MGKKMLLAACAIIIANIIAKTLLGMKMLSKTLNVIAMNENDSQNMIKGCLNNFIFSLNTQLERKCAKSV